MIAIKFNDSNIIYMGDVWQYDYGQSLQIEGLNLPSAVEVHFSLSEKDGDSITRIGSTTDGVTTVTIPDSMLTNGDTNKDYKLWAFIYLSDSVSGETVKKVVITVRSRPKPEASGGSDDGNIFGSVVEAVNNAADSAGASAIEAESWAHGHADRPERDADNAKHYAEQAAEALISVKGTVQEGKKDIDDYVRSKESELKGDTGNVYFTGFKVVSGRLKMISDPSNLKTVFKRVGSRLKYRLNL